MMEKDFFPLRNVKMVQHTYKKKVSKHYISYNKIKKTFIIAINVEKL